MDTDTFQRIPRTFEQSRAQIEKLVTNFNTNRNVYLDSTYKEAQVRQEFIDHFFIALGWDVRNYKRLSPNSREVQIEDSLDIEDEHRKNPDYSFQYCKHLKFYVEAKKPSVTIKADRRPAFQLRSYAWNRKLEVSLLTNFEELAIYDGRFRPSETQGAKVARTDYYTSDEYLDKWKGIWGTFSRDAVERGAFDKYAHTEKRGTSEVDEEFLSDIETWRDVLARNIALRNNSITTEQLRDAVQRTIDRLVFLRMAEDRFIEQYKRLLRLTEGEDSYSSFITMCRQADAKYNSGLFDFSRRGDSLTPQLQVDDLVFAPILRRLYPPQSPYRFNILPIAILGNVYEQFLGKVIRLTEAHQAKIEEKPEVKKAGGVYYTPTHIVDLIVHNTIGLQIEGKTPQQLRTYRVIDIACGSGSFLIGAYQFLLDYYLQWYMSNEPAKFPKAVWQFKGSWRLTTNEKKRILTSHIFGVDIDHQAVEVTKLSLLLKVLDGETDETLSPQLPGFEDRALPALESNIKCGNSLIAHDYFDGESLRDTKQLKFVNPFDWEAHFPDALKKSGGFDAVIGNPPYIDSECMTEYYPAWRQYCVGKYKAASGNWDVFCVFIEKALQLCKRGGLMGFIVPNKLGSTPYAAGAREVVTSDNTLVLLRDYSRVPVFPVAVYPIVVTARRSKPAMKGTVRYERMLADKGGRLSRTEMHDLDYRQYFGKPEDPWQVFATISTSTDPIKRMRENHPALSTISDVTGAATVAEAYDIQGFIHECRQAERGHLRLVNSGTIDRYRMLWGHKPCRYLGKVFDKPVIREHDLSKLPTKRLTQAQSPKIIIAGMTLKLECAADLKGKYLAGKSTTVVITQLELLYLASILNSRAVSFFYEQMYGGNKLAGGYLRIGPPQIETIPVPVVKVDDRRGQELVNQLTALSTRMMELNELLNTANTEHDKAALQRQIAATDGRIDPVVYALYGFSREEVSLIEEAAMG